MSKQIFINLPVKDLKRSIGFFTKLGFKFNPQFTNENATSLIVADNISVMLLVEKFFKMFTPKEICDAGKSTEVILCLSMENRQRVNELVAKAVDAGGSTVSAARDHGWMYQHGFQDLDGHLWELAYMDPKGPPK